MIWSSDDFGVNKSMVGTFAAFGGLSLFGLVSMAIKVKKQKITTGIEGLIGQIGEVLDSFVFNHEKDLFEGKVRVDGSIWSACASKNNDIESLTRGDGIYVESLEPGMLLVVNPKIDSP